MKLKVGQIRKLIRESLDGPVLSEGLRYHLDHGVGVDRNIYRPGSNKFFALFREVRHLHRQGLYEACPAEQEYLDTDLGEFGDYHGHQVPLDWPMLYSEADDDDPCWKGYEMVGMKDKGGKQVPNCVPVDEADELEEAKYKGREVELSKPKRGQGGKAYVYVRNDKGNVIKLNFGSSMPDAMGDSEKARKRRKSFGDRHDCANKKDRTKAGYWSCRATKFFGRNIPGWW